MNLPVSQIIDISLDKTKFNQGNQLHEEMGFYKEFRIRSKIKKRPKSSLQIMLRSLYKSKPKHKLRRHKRKAKKTPHKLDITKIKEICKYNLTSQNSPLLTPP